MKHSLAALTLVLLSLPTQAEEHPIHKVEMYQVGG